MNQNTRMELLNIGRAMLNYNSNRYCNYVNWYTLNTRSLIYLIEIGLCKLRNVINDKLSKIGLGCFRFFRFAYKLLYNT